MTKKIPYGPEHLKGSKGHGSTVDVLYELVAHEGNPRAALFVAHSFIEILISALAEHYCPNASGFS
jgi:hypothetical protein